MTTIYARTNGSDSGGSGSFSSPFATLSKSIEVAGAGDIILMGAGTYVENSGSGTYMLSKNFANYVRIMPESGNLGDVIITAVSGSYSFVVSTSSFVEFRNIVFTSHATTVSGVIRFVAAAIANVRFVNCRADVLGQSGSTNTGVVSAWSAGTNVSNVEFVDFSVKEIGPYPCAGVILDVTAGSATGIKFIKPNIHVGSRAMQLQGLRKFQVHNAELESFDTTVAGTCFQVGVDASTGADTTGVITNLNAYAATGHATVIGAGCSDVHLIGGHMVGGSNSSNGQGLVIKNATGGRVSDVTVNGGYNSTLYLKACSGFLIEHSHFFNQYATSPAIRVGVNSENGSKASNNSIRSCYAYASTGKVISWEGDSGDGGNNVCDQNTYNISGSATLGTIRGISVSTIKGARAAWSGYSTGGNDSNSNIGILSMRHTGNRVIKNLD